MSRRSKICRAALLAAMLTAGWTCTEPIGYIRTRYAAVYGVVTSATGTTAAGAHIHILAFAHGCSGTTTGSASLTSDNTGRYWVNVVGYDVAENPACISVSARGPAATDSTVVVGAMVLFTNNYEHFGDSVRVDVRLP